MAWQISSYTWALLLTTLLSGVLTVLAWRRRHIPGAPALIFLMLANVVWSFGYMLELSTSNLNAQIFWAKFEYLGIVSITVLWYIFTIQYTRQEELITRGRLILLFLIPILGLLAVWTNEWHRLVWSSIHQVSNQGLTILSLEHGAAFWLIVLYSYVMMLAGTIVLVRTFTSASAYYRRQIEIMLAGAAVPWIGNALYNFGISPTLDLTPFAFAITGAIASWGLYRYGILDIVPLARDRVIEMMSDGVIVVDTQNRILDLNPAARRLIGAPVGNDTTQPIGLFIGQNLTHALSNWPEIVKQCEAKSEVSIDFPIPTPRGRRYFEAHISEINDHGKHQTGHLVVLRDITERKQTETDLLIAKEAAEAASRAKSTFLANMSHELRTPLTVIMGYTDILRYEAIAKNNDKNVERLQSIELAAQHLLNLINDILDLSKIEAGRMALAPETFSVEMLVNQTLESVRPLAERNRNTLKREVAPNIGSMTSDPTRIRQVLFNLLSNATKFTEDGNITCRVYRSNEDGRFNIIFEIIDTGIGMSPEYQLQMFEPFSQADPSSTRKYGGTGLGLAVTKRLCTMLGGEISVKSQLGAGSTFTVSLPAALSGEKRL
jgi:PAS domain S-box-containing protein